MALWGSVDPQDILAEIRDLLRDIKQLLEGLPKDE